jgi:amino acid permease
MLLILLVNAIAIAAYVVLYIIAKAGIRHYMDLYQNEKDTKNLSYIVHTALIIAILGSLISCTLMFTESRYNTINKTEVENVIRR